ncbi:Phage integrase family protein [Tepidibacter thalassicus DSM 15285]|uniref:Phage integrase family protein n=1 Tax=Tepidibacter thalassicus DSM 15285 TaxID=1123350 RepID=A0A1M5QKU4_9FIRM|nr:tyrosine-type recombinase/integrase [Tepidibacter thalassicus]SHH14608.1 Phage integrase family protein [Tepidibacter thalassicus DSM 15285]
MNDIHIIDRNGKNNYSYITIRRGKGNKYREVLLNNKAKKAVLEYLKVRPLSKRNKLFIGQRENLTRSTINRIIEKY